MWCHRPDPNIFPKMHQGNSKKIKTMKSNAMLKNEQQLNHTYQIKITQMGSNTPA